MRPTLSCAASPPTIRFPASRHRRTKLRKASPAWPSRDCIYPSYAWVNAVSSPDHSERAAGAGGAQGQEEDHAAADGHDAHLAADYRQGQGLLVGFGEGFEVDIAELALGGAGAGALGEEGDDERQDPVELVQVFSGFGPGADGPAPRHRLGYDEAPGRTE